MDINRYETDEGPDLPTILVGSQLRKQFKTQLDEGETRRRGKTSGIYQLKPGNWTLLIDNDNDSKQNLP